MINLDELRVDGFWYIATPYSGYPHGPALAFTHAAQAAGALLKNGIHVFCPITHGHPMSVAADVALGDHDLWLSLDERFMKVAHGMIVIKMPGWKESKGIAHEIAFFEAAGKPIHYFEWPSDLGIKL